LDANQSVPEIEDEVVALIAERSGDAHAQFGGGMCNRELRDCSLLI